VIRTNNESINPSKPKKMPLNVINRIGFFERVTKPNIPKSIKNGSDALLLPLFLLALLYFIVLHLKPDAQTKPFING
jgi:hypothetical protein